MGGLNGGKDLLQFWGGNGKGISEEVMVIGRAYLTQGLRSRTAPGHPNARCGLVSQWVVCNIEGTLRLQCLVIHNFCDQIVRQP